MRFKLISADNLQTFELKSGAPQVVGRAPTSDIPVFDPTISRRHAAIVIHTSDGCELHDTASKNGTFLNGQRIGGPTAIKSGDEIRLCDRCVRFFTGNVTPAPPDDRSHA